MQNPFDRLCEALVEASNALQDLEIEQSDAYDDRVRKTIDTAIDLATRTAQDWQTRCETPRNWRKEER